MCLSKRNKGNPNVGGYLNVHLEANRADPADFPNGRMETYGHTFPRSRDKSRGRELDSSCRR